MVVCLIVLEREVLVHRVGQVAQVRLGGVDLLLDGLELASVGSFCWRSCSMIMAVVLARTSAMRVVQLALELVALRLRRALYELWFGPRLRACSARCRT